MTHQASHTASLQAHDSPLFEAARKDLFTIFMVSFAIHLLSLILMLYYLSLSLGTAFILQTAQLTMPIVAIGFLVSFVIFYGLHRHLCTFFIFGQAQEKLALQKESLNYPYISIAGFLVWVTVGILVSSMKERDFIRSTFNRYLDPSLVETILNGKHELGGSEMEASVMFADIRGFTSLSEQLTPEQVVELLNEYFEDMVQEITATDSIPDKFMGDGLMAIWGVPSADQNHAQKACHAAISMLSRLKIINEHRLARELPLIEIGIGIHSGRVIAGNIGSRKKMEYTVIGDTVNTSSRLEGLCKTLQAELLISGEVFQQLSKSLQQQFHFSCSKQLRGKLKETEIYQFIPLVS